MPAKKAKAKTKTAHQKNRPSVTARNARTSQKIVPANRRKASGPKPATTKKRKTESQKQLERVALKATQALLTAKQTDSGTNQLCERIKAIEHKQGDHLRMIDILVARVTKIEEQMKQVVTACNERTGEHNKVVGKLQTHSDTFKEHDKRADALRERLNKIDSRTQPDNRDRTNYATLKALADLNGTLLQRDTEISDSIAAIRKEIESMKATATNEGQL